MPDPSAPDPTTAGSRSPLFRRFLTELEAGREPDIEVWCARHPGQAETLLAEHSAWQADQSLIGDLGFSADVDDVELVPQRRKPSEFERGLLERLGPREAAFGRYRIGDEIGHGGMGTVYEVFDEDLRRTLAMKVIRRRRGARSLRDEELSRFVDEAQVSGQLQHPGIVPVHDLGLDDQGQLFFTMKLVQGVTLAEVFRLRAEGSAEWSDARVLGVLLRVCEAVAYAHDQGVVHRDLKPSNVMVGDFGEVYVLDWGLAMLADDDTATGAVRTDRADERASSSDSPSRTAPGRALGTALYCAPEQARGERDAIGPRSDVYSIGAMLYELLLGRPPYIEKGERPDRATVLERVRTGEPDPATRLSAARPAELAAICERAMARAPEARFEDVEGLAEELRAFVEGRVVRSFESGAWAEARKWIRRNRALTFGIAATFIAATVGVAAWMRVTQIEKNRAQSILREQGRLQNLVALQAGIFREVDPRSMGQSLWSHLLAEFRIARERLGQSPEEIADAEARFVESLTAVNFTNLGVQVLSEQILEPARERLLSGPDRDPETLNSIRSAIAESLANIGRLEDAEEVFLQVLDSRRSELEPGDPGLQEPLSGLASTLEERGQYERALALREEELEISRRTWGDSHPETLTSLNNLALLLNLMGQYERALDILLPVLETRRAAGEDAESLVPVLSNAGSALDDLFRLEEALEMYQEALVLCRAQLPPDSLLTLSTLGNVGFMLRRLDRLEEARPFYEEALAGGRRVRGDDHPDTISDVANMASLLHAMGEVVPALEMSEETVERARRVLGPLDPSTLTYISNLAVQLDNFQRHEEALALFEESLEGRRQVLSEGHPDVQSSLSNLSTCLANLGRLDEAESMQREALLRARNRFGDEHENVITRMHNLATVLEQKGEFDEARALYEESLALSLEVLGSDHDGTVRTIQNLGVLCKTTGDTTSARSYLERAYATRMRTRGPANVDTVTTGGHLAALESDLANYDRARELYQQGLGVMREKMGPGHPESRAMLHNVGFTYYQQGRFAEALERFAEVYALVLDEGGATTREKVAALAYVKICIERLPASEEYVGYLRDLFVLAVEYGGAASHGAIEQALTLIDYLNQLERVDEALVVCEEVLEARVLAEGVEDSGAIAFMGIRGSCLTKLGELEAALTCLEEASALAAEALEESHDSFQLVRAALDECYAAIEAAGQGDD